MDDKKLNIEGLDLSALDKLSEEEKAKVFEILNDIGNNGYSEEYNKLLYADYNEIPVDILTFVDDYNYLGNAWHDTKGNSKLFPYWRNELTKIFPNNLDTNFNNAILTGSRGRGKSEIACLIVAYLMYRVLCLKNPIEHFHLKNTETIAFAFMNIDIKAAKSIANSKFQNTLKSSPWFLNHGTLEGRSNKLWTPPKFRDSEGNLRPMIEIIIGSQSNHVIGRPIYAAFFDEISFIQNKNIDEQKKKAKNMIDTALGGMKTRFIYKGKNPTMLLLASSKRSEVSFLESYMKDKLEKDKVSPPYISDGAVWECHPKEEYGDKWFKVAVGNKFLQSKIIPTDADEATLADFIKKYGEKNIINVPEVYKGDFEMDIERSLCDYAGISSSSINKYINGDAFEALVNKNRCNAFDSDVLEIGDGKDDDRQYYNFFHIERIPEEYRNKPLFIHLDMSVSGDKTGIGGVVIAGKKPSVDPAIEDHDLFYSLVFSTSIKAPHGHHVSFAKNRNFIYWLKAQGFNIRAITSDTFQSYDTGEELKAKGYNYSILSVDRVSTDKICLLGNTLIKTSQGFKEIKDLIPGEEIYSYDIENDCEILTTFNSWAETGYVNDYYEIETVDGSKICCTGNHLILTNRGYVRADELTENDEIVQISDDKLCIDSAEE